MIHNLHRMLSMPALASKRWLYLWPLMLTPLACVQTEQVRGEPDQGISPGKSEQLTGLQDTGTDNLDTREADTESVAPPEGMIPEEMIHVQGATFSMGSESTWALPEEYPVHQVQQSGFWIDTFEVSNAQFAEFVRATDYVTTAEKPIPLEQIMAQLEPGSPEPSPEVLVPSSLVFRMPFPEQGQRGGWELVPGANWRHPEGPGSTIEGREQHPVVQVSWWDAKAYAKWVDKELPTEAQWELAARGGIEQADFAWGAEPADAEHPPLNMWQGIFPRLNTAQDGFQSSAPIGTYPPNGFGLHEMAGNVWEWCEDRFDARAYHNRSATKPASNPLTKPTSHEDLSPRSLRGGSFLCSDNYCTRYRPSARTGNTPDSATNHMGFRCVQTTR